MLRGSPGSGTQGCNHYCTLSQEQEGEGGLSLAARHLPRLLQLPLLLMRHAQLLLLEHQLRLAGRGESASWAQAEAGC